MLEQILAESDERMKKAVEVLAGELRSIRTGRANPALLEGLRVDYYGTPTPLRQIAQVSAPDAKTLLIRPFDAAALPQIVRAIQGSDLGLNPANDGRVVRISVPPLSEERRKQLAQHVKKAGETAKVHVRNVRRDINRRIDELEREKKIPEDEKFRLKERLQKALSDWEKQVDEMIEKKTREILEM